MNPFEQARQSFSRDYNAAGNLGPNGSAFGRSRALGNFDNTYQSLSRSLGSESLLKEKEKAARGKNNQRLTNIAMQGRGASNQTQRTQLPGQRTSPFVRTSETGRFEQFMGRLKRLRDLDDSNPFGGIRNQIMETSRGGSRHGR